VTDPQVLRAATTAADVTVSPALVVHLVDRVAVADAMIATVVTTVVPVDRRGVGGVAPDATTGTRRTPRH
jgi:hypothetical protein